MAKKREIISKYVWRTIYLMTIALGIYLVSRPVKSLINSGREISALEREKEHYKTAILNDSLFIESLENDEVIEQYAREKYFMQKKNEQMFIVE